MCKDNGINIPNKPDPFWPVGVKPTHLTPEEQRLEATKEAFIAIKGPMWECKVCHTQEDQSIVNPDLCRDCYATESQNSALAQKINQNWIEEAKEIGLAIFERQPEETDTEWQIWEKYRSFYPLKLPTYAELAKETGHAITTVVKTAQKWSFKVRLVAWSRYTDAGIQTDRVNAIKDMNTKQLHVASTIMDKLKTAVEGLDPTTLQPKDIASMLKIAADLERRIQSYIPETVENEAIDSKKAATVTKTEDLSEVISILQNAGVLKENGIVAIEQVTRVIAKGAEDE